jgi:hypothetical protein
MNVSGKREWETLKKPLFSRALKDIKTAEQNLVIDEEAAYAFAYLFSPVLFYVPYSWSYHT